MHQKAKTSFAPDRVNAHTAGHPAPGRHRQILSSLFHTLFHVRDCLSGAWASPLSRPRLRVVQTAVLSALIHGFVFASGASILTINTLAQYAMPSPMHVSLIASRPEVRPASRADTPTSTVHKHAAPPMQNKTSVKVTPADQRPRSHRPAKSEHGEEHIAPRPQVARAYRPEPAPGSIYAPLDAPPPLHSPPPRYPEEARWENRTGSVVIRFQLGANGTVRRVSVLSSSGHTDLDAAAIGSAQRWRFPPRNDEDGATWYHLRFRFQLL